LRVSVLTGIKKPHTGGATEKKEKRMCHPWTRGYGVGAFQYKVSLHFFWMEKNPYQHL